MWCSNEEDTMQGSAEGTEDALHLKVIQYYVGKINSAGETPDV